MEHKIRFQFTGRYYTLGKMDEAVEQLWVVCHGQGHLAQYFIRQFECLNDGRHLIVAPEGLSRYYLNGYTGRVGATWMTREDRLTDIDNYLTFLLHVTDQVRTQLRSTVKVTLLGFSQGTATIARFAAQTEVAFDRLVLWAGIFPPDLPLLKSRRKLAGKACYWVYGTEDPYFDERVVAEQERIAGQLKITPEVMNFGGKHELYENILLRISNQPYRQK